MLSCLSIFVGNGTAIIQQALINLVRNAVEAAPANVAPVRLRAIRGRDSSSMSRVLLLSRTANMPLVPTRNGEAPLLAVQRRRWAA